jgi:AraC-like DNA-binding protein
VAEENLPLVWEAAAMAVPANTLVRSSSFVSWDADELTEFIRQMFVGNRSSFTAVRDRRARFEAHAGAVADLSYSQVRSTIDYRVATEPFDTYVFFAVHGGRIRICDGADDVRAPQGAVGFHPLGIALDASAEDLDARFLQLPIARLDQVADEIAGIAPGKLEFHAITPVSASMRQYWWSLMGLLGGATFAPDSPMSSPLVAEEMIRAAAVGALHVFPNTTMTRQHMPGPGKVGPAALRRAVAFIDANAGRPVTLSDVAAAAGTGSRAVQAAFRRHYGTTPLGYARRVRLDHAHRELQAADPVRGDTVAAIAARWGFAKPDRFASYYRDAYGVLPSHTLRY